MRSLSRLGLLLLFMPLLGSLGGCQTYYRYVRYTDSTKEWLLNHRSPMVRNPAKAGQKVGVYAGWPLHYPCLVFWLFPESVTGTILRCRDESDFLALVYAPSFVLGALCEHAVGVPCWMLFGWWWPESQEKEGEPKVPKQPATT